jgi:branched-chain amino acid transport system permease protein
MAACIGAGMIAALGGALFAHYATYIEPANFDVMLGIHSLTYCLIGGLASVFGPLLGVCIDVVLLQASGFLAAYRMIVFGGLVALMLIVKPRGILDERTCAVLARMWRRARGGR